MDSNQQSKLEFWREHVAGAEKFPAGVSAYCTEQGLKISTYYGWRKLVKPSGSAPKRPKSLKPKVTKKIQSPFLPVAVAAGAVEIESRVTSPLKLPEARWVAEVMLYLMRGLL